MKYLWTEDTGAGLHFWELVNQLFFDDAFVIESKEICVRTTEYYTLEPEIVNTGDNYKILKNKYGDVFGWNDMTAEQLTEAWKNAKATDMFTICKDLASGELEGFQMPKHIQDVIDFLSQESEEVL